MSTPSSIPRPLPKAETRERLPTVDLDDGDIVESSPTPPAARSVPPPLPPKKSSVPPPAPTSDVRANEPVAPAPVIPAAPSVPRALSLTDPADVIFEGVFELHGARSEWEAARVCASLLSRALGARAVVVHSHDLVARELRAIGAHGEADVDVLGSSEPSDDDLVAAAVICNQRSVTMRFDGDLPRSAPARLHAVGAPRSVVAVPAIAWGRCLAIIEIIDPDPRLDERVADSAAYVAERFAEYLLARAA